jgi:hypothetical protein
MTTWELIAEKARELPADKQHALLDFAEFLHTRPASQRPLVSAAGLWANLGVDITSEDIDEARREMWGNFPREDI